MSRLITEAEAEALEELASRLVRIPAFASQHAKDRDLLRAIASRPMLSTLGVGDGSGRLFVYGDYDSVKACQRLILGDPITGEEGEPYSSDALALARARGELVWFWSEVWPLVHGLTSRETVRERFRRLPALIRALGRRS